MTAQTAQTPPQTEPQQVQVQLDKTELDMVFKLARDKEEALKLIGMRFLATLEATKHYGGILAGEQQFLQSISVKYELPPQSYLQFGKDGVLTATIPAQPQMPPVEQPPVEQPPAEETDGESAG